ncbi:MAG TPA: response regulator transcription factor, partial [Gammaproteobacteria bacterium]|nr:response regulator transcription factor [Gammaproteobacteria bacterium]
ALQLVEGEPDLDLVLLDIAMPGLDGGGWEVLRTLRAHHPDIPVVVLSASEQPEDVTRALEQGALGFVPKSTPTEHLLHALRLVLAGGTYAPAHLLEARPAAAPESGPANAGTNGLTPRQQEVLRLLARGHSNRGIGEALDLSPETVKVHVRALYRTLGVQNRTQAVQEAGRRGLLPAD